jgi:hypothetical protein
VSAQLVIGTEPRAVDALAARVLAAIDQLNDPIERGRFWTDLQAAVETPTHRRCLALLVLLAALDRAHASAPKR